MDVERVRKYLEENPIAYAGLRALDISDKGREESTAEKDEVPFIFSVFFIPLIIAYTVLRRAAYCLKRGFGQATSDPVSPPDHVFIMTSTHAYRTYTFEEVGSRLLEEEEDVMFLCSPSAADRMDEWRAKGFRTASFTQLLRFVRVSDLLANVVRAVIAMYGLRNVTSGEFEESSLIYALNSTFLESLKFSSLKPFVGSDLSLHTYSLMPYQVLATTPDRLYVYQHGVQFTPKGDYSGARTFFPSTLLLWGEAWVENFEPLIHPETEIHVTGSPWHDHLSESKEVTTTEWDVLFLGGSQVTNHSEKRERLYEEFVTHLVRSCEDNGWSLAIKLHPTESVDWYRQHGYEHYIEEFESLEDAVNSTDIAVTHYSSAFVECIALGTPVVLSEAFSDGLSNIRPVEGAYFTDNDYINVKKKKLKRTDPDSNNIIQNNRLLQNPCSINSIVNLILYDQ